LCFLDTGIKHEIQIKVEMSNTMDILYQDIGQRIKEARESKGLTQQDLADKIELTRSSVANIELGRQRIQIHVLYDFAKALDIPPFDLLPPKSVSSEASEQHEVDQEAESFLDILKSKRREGEHS
jgi:transcriptional regulator with XRE-family HTH domain